MSRRKKSFWILILSWTKIVQLTVLNCFYKNVSFSLHNWAHISIAVVIVVCAITSLPQWQPFSRIALLWRHPKLSHVYDTTIKESNSHSWGQIQFAGRALFLSRWLTTSICFFIYKRMATAQRVCFLRGFIHGDRNMRDSYLPSETLCSTIDPKLD